MKYARIYFVKGAPRGKDKLRRMDYGIKDPPVAGNSMAFILGTGKKLTIFHPFTLTAFTVSHDCTEVKSADIRPFEIDRMAALITEKWKLYKELDMQRSYDVAAQVLLQLGSTIPTYTGPSTDRRGKMPDDKVGGKASDMARFKFVKRKGRKGDVAAFFYESSRPIVEAMATLHMTRSAVLSQLYMLWKDHGIGYRISQERVELISEFDIFQLDFENLELEHVEDIELDDEEDIFS